MSAPCSECASANGAVYYASSDLGNAKGKFIRRQTAETHAALVDAKERLKRARTRLAAHVEADHSGQVAS